MAEITVAVMGMTGAGKSSFIERLTLNESIVVGNGLESETQTVTEYRCRYGGKMYVLLDTPGFGDTYRSNDDIVDEVLQWLASSYRAGTRLSGVIYLHPINDVRMQGSARENLEMFRKLCGEDALKKVFFVSTFWDTADEALGVRNEEQLRSKDEFWGRMVKKGSKVRRYNRDDPLSAFAILNDIDDSHCVLRAQEEIVIDGKDPRQTEAATFNFAAMQAEMEAQIREEEELAKRLLEKQQRAAREQARRIREQHQQWLRAQEEEAKRKKARLEAEERREEERARKQREFCQRMRQEAEAREVILAAIVAAQEEEEERMQEATAEYYRDYACIGREVSRDYDCDRCNTVIHYWDHYYHLGKWLTKNGAGFVYRLLPL
ncbi:P-loop containing nucleoside triphosphate hydrolase protein [Elaphomyces granulatus]